jgi:hypothetical protein
MKKNSLLTYLFIGLLSFGFVSCSDDDSDSPAVNEKEVEVQATAYDKWTYFSFEKGTVVGSFDVEQKRESLDWDIAFHRWDIRLNCGKSGSGKGGALLVDGKVAKTGWDALTEAPENGYEVDGTLEVTKKMAQMGKPEKATVGASNVITGNMMKKGTWMTMSYMGQGVRTYEYSNQIFVVKTADGKYVKVWLKAYTKLVEGSKKGGYITMKYAYQPDGSRSFR